MFRQLFIILFFTFVNQNSIAQDSLANQVGLHVGLNRMDVFSGVCYSMRKEQLLFFVTAETGVNRTFIQNRIFPRIGIGTVYYLLSKTKIKLGPLISYNYSFLKVNNNSEHLHQWNEIYLGSKLEIGTKLRFTNVISGGWMNERYYNQFTNKKSGVNSMGFYTSLGLAYVW